MKSVIGSYPIGSAAFTVRGIPGSQTAISGLRLSNESSATLQIEWGGESQVLHPATVDIFPTPARPTTDLTITPLNVFPAGASATGSLLVESAVTPDKWTGSYPMSLPPGVINVGTVSGNVTIGGNVPVLNAPGSQLATYQQGQLLTPVYTVAANTVPPAKRITIQPGMQVLSIFQWGPTPLTQNPFVSRTTVTGVTTGYPYQKSMHSYTNPDTPLRILVDYAYETQFDLIVDTTWAPVPDKPVSVAILGGPNPVEQIMANIQDSSGYPITTDFKANLQATLANANPAPWQAANQPPLNLGLAVAANTTTVLIPGIVGQRIYLHELSFQFTGTGTANGNFNDDGGAGTSRFSWNDGIRGPFTMNFKGAPLPVGAAFRITNATAVGSQFLNGSLSYSQAA